MEIINQFESEVRSYCRSFPVVFQKSQGSWLTDQSGRRYLDFFAGAGTLNYGHNDPDLIQSLMDYLQHNGIIHSLDMATEAKIDFLRTFQSLVLAPRGLEYKVQFTGPTGTNAVESALKIARKVTGRTNVISFTNAFHGMTLGSLAVTGNAFKRKGAGIPLTGTTFMPYDGYHGSQTDTTDMLNRYLLDFGSGVEKPAAVILETVQGEGGVNVASTDWLKKVASICKDHDILLIVDDIQVGCGRTGRFFSFEEAGIQPDIVCLSKALSGVGLPFALTLLRPELDIWKPGEHNGTFRGHNLAFVTATMALKKFWEGPAFSNEVQAKADYLKTEVERMLKPFDGVRFKGRGLITGIEFEKAEMASNISKQCFEKGLIMETSGIDDQVLKILPPLTVTTAELDQGLEIVEGELLKMRKLQ